jgi:DNA-binding response OmpR family regulator
LSVALSRIHESTVNLLALLVHSRNFTFTLKDTEPMRILIIEDEPRMLELLCKGLYESGFTVMTAADGEIGLAMATAHELDAIVLDIGLPKMNGYALMKALRERGCRTPVLMLTARDTEDDIIHGLGVGADDYLTKPFSFPELVARLQSITRRRRQVEETIHAGDLVIDPIRRTVMRKGESIELTRLEYQLLARLVQSMDQCVPRQTLMEFVWGKEHEVGSTALDVLMNALRAKVDARHSKKLIVTVRGFGYLFRRFRYAATEER